MSFLPQSHSLSSWILIPCSLHNGNPDGTEPGPKDWGPKDVGLCHGMRWEEKRKKSLKEESKGNLWGVRGEDGQREIGWWKLPDRPVGRAPRHRVKPRLLRVSWMPWVMVENALRCHPRWGNDQRGSPGKSPENRHFQRQVPELDKLSVAPRWVSYKGQAIWNYLCFRFIFVK